MRLACMTGLILLLILAPVYLLPRLFRTDSAEELFETAARTSSQSFPNFLGWSQSLSSRSARKPWSDWAIRRCSSLRPKSIIYPLARAISTWGSRGMPRPLAEMMFFWICEVPPPMIRPMSYI